MEDSWSSDSITGAPLVPAGPPSRSSQYCASQPGRLGYESHRTIIRHPTELQESAGTE